MMRNRQDRCFSIEPNHLSVQLAASLELDQELLAALNNREPEYIFAAESWFVIPSDSRSRASMLVNVDAGSVRLQLRLRRPRQCKPLLRCSEEIPSCFCDATTFRRQSSSS